MRKILLYPFAILYDVVTSIRNFLYDKKKFSSRSFSIPVISVGNLSTGGTGKTPHAEYLVDLLSKKYKIAYLSRGYRRKTKGFLLLNESHTSSETGDESMQVFRKFPETPVAVCEDRVVGIETLIKCFPELQVIILDDAFQHRAVQPSLSVLLTEYSKPYFKDVLLPAGNLRESRSNSRRSDVIIVTKSPKEVNEQQKELFLKYIQPAPGQIILFSYLQYGPLQSFAGKPSIQWQSLKNYDIVLFTGIGNTKPLTEFLEKNCKSLVSFTYADHHYFSDEEISKITEKFDTFAGQNKIILTTEKDFARLNPDTIRTHFNTRSAFFITVKVNFNKEEEIKFNTIVLNHVAKNKTNS